MEVVFALALISLVSVAIVGLATVSIRNNISSRNSTAAKRYAQETMDWLRKVRDVRPWSEFSASAGTYCLPTLSEVTTVDGWSIGTQGGCDSDEADDYISGTQLLRELDLTAGTDKMLVEVTVSWFDSKGTHVSKLTTELVKW